MNIIKFSIYRQYEIMCKLFLPKIDNIKHIIIGVHGFAGDKESSMLEVLADQCADNATALICFDFPAHGASPVDENMLTVENCKEDLLAIANYVRERYPNAEKSIFATSFGGYISLLCYEKLSEFGLVCRAPAITMPELLLTTVLKISPESFKEVGFVDCGFERSMRLPYSFYEELLRQEKPSLQNETKPVLIIHGDSDDIVPLEVIREFSDIHKNVELYVIKGADHRFKNAGEPEKIVTATRRFLGI